MSADATLEQQIAKITEMRAEVFKKRIDELVGVYGSVRAVGRALDIDHAYIHRLCSGEKQNPSKAVMVKLGLAY